MTGTPSIFSGLGRNILLLGVVSLLTDMSSQIVFPLLPLFLTTVLGAGAVTVGIIEGAAESTAALLKVASGYWSDKIRKRRIFIIWGYSLSAAFKPLFALAGSVGFVLVIRVFERLGKGLRTAPRDALLAESCPPEMRARAFGFHRTMDGVGSVLGALLAYLLLPVLGYRNLFLFAVLPGVLAVLATLLVQELQSPSLPAHKPQLAVNFRQLSVNLRRFIVASSIFAAGNFGYAFLLLKTQSVGGTDRSALLYYVLFYVVYTLTAIPAGALADRIGKKRVLMAGFGVFILMSGGLMLVTSPALIPWFFVLYGLFYAMIDGVQRAFVVDLAPAHMKGVALGTYHAAMGLVALPGGFLMGWLWMHYSPSATFGLGVITGLVALALFGSVKEAEPTPAG